MAQAIVTEVVKNSGMTLSTMIWRLLKRQPEGFLEATLEFNQDLPKEGIFVPPGTTVRFPMHLLQKESREDEVIRLWD